MNFLMSWNSLHKHDRMCFKYLFIKWQTTFSCQCCCHCLPWWFDNISFHCDVPFVVILSVSLRKISAHYLPLSYFWSIKMDNQKAFLDIDLFEETLHQYQWLSFTSFCLSSSSCSKTVLSSLAILILFFYELI